MTQTTDTRTKTERVESRMDFHLERLEYSAKELVNYLASCREEGSLDAYIGAIEKVNDFCRNADFAQAVQRVGEWHMAFNRQSAANQ